MIRLIFQGKKGKGGSFWSEIGMTFSDHITQLADDVGSASAVPGRTLQSVYRYVRRAHDPQAYQGDWMNAEDTLLRK
jgi:hypothetical protein